MAKKLTTNQILFDKQINRISRLINRKKGEGFIIDESLFLPKERPKRVTKQAIQRLKDITPDVIYKQSKYQTKSGNTISAEERMFQVRSEASKKGWKTRRNREKLAKQFKRPPKAQIPEDKIAPNYVGLWDELEDRINELRTELYWGGRGRGHIDLSPTKDLLIRTWQDTRDKFEKENMLTQLDDYLMANEIKIEQLFRTIDENSDGGKVQTAIPDIVQFLKVGKPMTAEEMEEVEFIQNMYQGYDDDFDDFDDILSIGDYDNTYFEE